MSLQITFFACGPFATNAYILSDSTSKEAVIVDPAANSFPQIINYLHKKELTPKAIWLTHSHWDHIVDVSLCKKEFSIPIYLHKSDEKNLQQPGIDNIPIAVAPFEGAKVDFYLIDKMKLALGVYSFEVIHSPGHSPGSVCFYCAEESVLISGDTLFKGAIGAINLPTSEPEKMWDSLKKLSQLPPNTHIYPGHGEKTILSKERWIHHPIQSAKTDLNAKDPTHIDMKSEEENS